jgi:tetratricopeptide (TPR) repeat protein
MGTAGTRERKRQGLWAYNARILLGNTYWLVVVPVAATQIVLFWAMATVALRSASRATQTIEMLAPLLAAFLCSHALAPEEDRVGELVFIRPVSVERVLLLRLSLIFGFVLVLLAPAFAILAHQTEGFSPIMTAAATAPSVIMLSMVAMVAASLARNPMLGFAAAAGYWALDVALGGYFNPLVTLHGYADSLAVEAMSELWPLNKVTLLAIGALLYVLNRRLLTRPPAPRRWMAAVRAGVVVVLLLVAYIASGAVYKVTYGMRHEGELGRHARTWYQQQFRGYGPLPVAWVFGPAFVRYVQAKVGRDGSLARRGGEVLWTHADVPAMQWVIEHYPDSIWADNAQFELAVQAGRRAASRPWVVVAQNAGAETATTITVSDDLEEEARGYETLAEKYPDSPLAPLALAELAAARLLLLDLEGARAAYERLVAEHPTAAQSCEAGLALATLHLREGDFENALRAAEAAAGTAPWDRRAEALILGARAARESGQEGIARDRYTEALKAARESVERATRGEKTPSRVPKVILFPLHNAIMTEAEHGLSGKAAAVTVRPPEVTVAGRVVCMGEGLQAARVALGAEPAAGGLPSPFEEGPAASAAVNGDGSFRLAELPAGRYRVLAYAVRAAREGVELRVTGPGLPMEIEPPAVELAPIEILVSEPEVAPASRRPYAEMPASRGGRGPGRQGGGRRAPRR